MNFVSSCLIGTRCRYNGTNCTNTTLLNQLDGNFIDVCPEVLAGLSVPRLPCEIVGGNGKDVLLGNAKIIDLEQNDITDKLLFGANRALELCKNYNVTKAYLKQNSPTCGYGKIYDGTFTNQIISGNGIFAELLLSHGILITSY